MEALLRNLLGLPRVDVESYQESRNHLILQVEVHDEEATCPRCGYVSHHLHQNQGYLARDLDIVFAISVRTKASMHSQG